MSIVETIITPIITGVFIGAFVLWILFLIYKGIKSAFPFFNLWLKYKVFRKKWSDEAVKWCMDAIERGMSLKEAKKFLLIKGMKPKKVKEMEYVYMNVFKSLKGGNKYNEQLRQNNEQNEIPKI